MFYHTVTATLEDIGGIVTAKDKYGLQTVRLTFNVTVNGKRHFAVALNGAPHLKNGMAVTAVLRDPDNWQTLIAWRDRTTGAIFGVESPGERSLFFVYSLLVGGLFSVKALDASVGTSKTILLLLVAGVMNVWSLRSLCQSLAVYRLLRFVPL